MRTAAILPVKRFALAKQRLATLLDDAERAALMAAMVGDVLAALTEVDGLERVIVVSGEPRAQQLAREGGHELVDDAGAQGHNIAAAIGVARASTLGFERALLVPGDCPALDAGEVTDLLSEAPAAPSAVVVPDRHGSGTNALLLAPPYAIWPSFGPGSRARHEAAGATAGAHTTVAALRSLALDIDTPEDLDALRAALERSPETARRTRAALRELSSSALVAEG